MTQKKIIIGLATFKRPQMLKQTLKSLGLQKIDPAIGVELVLVDNDPEGSARELADEFKENLPFTLHYQIEEKRGIVAARNAVIEKALSLKGHYLAFIDDDEVAAVDWIERLLGGLVHYEADVVSGFSKQRIPSDSPEWVKKGSFFQLSSYASGTVRKSASTRNILFDLNKLCIEWGLRFDPALSFVGSSDTFFFEEAYLRGAKIIWIADACVVEEIPFSRLTVSWILNRSFRRGNSMVVRRRLRHGVASSFILLPRIVGELFWASILFLGSLPAGKHVRVRRLKPFYESLGMLVALSGYKYYEYRNVHGH